MRHIPKLAAVVGAVTIGLLGLQGAASASTQKGDGYGGGDDPIGYVARPGAQSGIEPEDSQKCKRSAGQLKEELLQRSPKALKTSLATRGCR